MKTDEIRDRFINYFVKQLGKDSHVEVPSSSLVPERHPSLLFVNSGMVQFTPYFLGEKDPVADFGSRRLCSVQKSFRTVDFDIIGVSKYHLTFFEMLGSWSIGDYGKEKAVEFAFDLLTNKTYGYGLDPSRFIPTVFAGNKDSKEDKDTINAWRKVGISDANISRLPESENWWAPAGLTGPGPCGPCTEVLYDRGDEFGPKEKLPGLTDNPRYLEIWNAGVFIQFNRDESGQLHKLETMSVDTGAGLERFAVLLQGVDSIYETDLFVKITDKLNNIYEEESGKKINKNNKDQIVSCRRIADHIRGITFLISENVYPSNKEQGYVLRKLIRNIFNDFEWKLNINPERIVDLIPKVVDIYKGRYPELLNARDISAIISEEITKTQKLKQLTTTFIKKNNSKSAFDIYQSTGGSEDLIKQIAKDLDVEIDFSDFDKQLEEHKALSRSGSEAKFKGGLIDHSKSTVKLHTATHLLQWALREVLGDHITQKGSNITKDRLRFDFPHKTRISDEDIHDIERLVNEKILENYAVKSVLLKKDKAEKLGALHVFSEKYGDEVNVYFIGENLDTAFSKEFCGGPHVSSTSEIGRVKIDKQEKIGTGVLRLYASINDGSN